MKQRKLCSSKLMKLETLKKKKRMRYRATTCSLAGSGRWEGISFACACMDTDERERVCKEWIFQLKLHSSATWAHQIELTVPFPSNCRSVGWLVGWGLDVDCFSHLIFRMRHKTKKQNGGDYALTEGKKSTIFWQFLDISRNLAEFIEKILQNEPQNCIIAERPDTKT